ncbi:MAG: T9SS type A sorting domain-containing protein [Bacteroidetes bacterium]|nr:T9SS type A sorting domain-containing protein [Bacteroidota bacterium]
MNKITLPLLLLLFTSIIATAQSPNPALIGYWHNWNDASAPYIQLDQVDSRYQVIDVSFAVPHFGTDYQMEFIPDQVSVPTMINQIQVLQNLGKKVIISMGGATAPISLDNISERDIFISTMGNILNTYNFDGIDIDFEGASLSVTGGTISAPADPAIVNLIYAVKQIMSNYFVAHNKKLLLTMAPETAFVQGGMSAYGGIWGAYLPVINALRDSLEILHVQLYNSGSMFGIDGTIYTQGTADFIVAMTEAVILGFNTNGGLFSGLPASKVAIGLPACSNAAGGGFADTAMVKSAVDYLLGNGPQPGSYVLAQAGGYPDLRGMMTWSINWDAVNTCASSYEFAENFENIFGSQTALAELNGPPSIFQIYPNPTHEIVLISTTTILQKNEAVHFYDSLGRMVFSTLITAPKQAIDISTLPAGIYFVQYQNKFMKLIKS